MRIGEVAEQAGVTTKALRYYERIGLLAEPARTESGYRDYPKAILDRLRFIRAAQAVGLTLGEIRSIIAFREQGSPPCSHVLSLIDARAADLDRRIAELGKLRTELRRLAKRGRSLSPEDCRPDLVCHILAPGADGHAAGARDAARLSS
jgi:MerR family copper efflux transcriptional regulator